MKKMLKIYQYNGRVLLTDKTNIEDVRCWFCSFHADSDYISISRDDVVGREFDDVNVSDLDYKISPKTGRFIIL